MNDLERITFFPVSGNDMVIPSDLKGFWETYNPENKSVRVWINKTQYFCNIPRIAWEYDMGGIYPAKKWLENRKGKKLSNTDKKHFLGIISSLIETYEIMNRDI